MSQHQSSSADLAAKVVTHEFQVDAPTDPVFALFDPIAERDWVPGWEPQAVAPPELSCEPGSVFFLDREHGREIWTVLSHDPRRHVAEYLATTPDFQQRWITVKCSEADQSTRVSVSYRLTALSDAGQAALADFTEADLRAWEAPVRAALGLS